MIIITNELSNEIILNSLIAYKNYNHFLIFSYFEFYKIFIKINKIKNYLSRY